MRAHHRLNAALGRCGGARFHRIGDTGANPVLIGGGIVFLAPCVNWFNQLGLRLLPCFRLDHRTLDPRHQARALLRRVTIAVIGISALRVIALCLWVCPSLLCRSLIRVSLRGKTLAPRRIIARLGLSPCRLLRFPRCHLCRLLHRAGAPLARTFLRAAHRFHRSLRTLPQKAEHHRIARDQIEPNPRPDHPQLITGEPKHKEARQHRGENEDRCQNMQPARAANRRDAQKRACNHITQTPAHPEGRVPIC